MWLRNNLANIITCFNLFFGCLAIINITESNFEETFYLVILAGIFDFFDGFVARALKSNSKIGKDLDSLADVVTFGVVPGYIMFKLISIQNELNPEFQITLLPLAGFLITVFSAWRLAKFNVDTRQTHSFIGLPTPANCIFIASLGYAHEVYEMEINVWMLVGTSLLLCWLLVSELHLMAMKFKTYGWRTNETKYIFLLISGVLLLIFKVLAVPLIMFLYIILSQIEIKVIKRKNKKHHEI